jgi:ribosome-associated translation inhibitor RaiA
MNRGDHAPAIEVEIVTSGDVPPGVRDYARRKIRDLARYSTEPILHARVRFTRHGDPAVERPVVAQANLDVNGRPIRAQIAAATAHEAADLLVDRVRQRLIRLARHWEARRGGRPTGEAGEWRHSSEPAHRPDHFPRPPAEREIVRHKSYALAPCAIEQAVFELEAMGYDFHLFTEAGSGQDSVVYRAGPTGYRVAQLTPQPDRLETGGAPVTLSAQPAPRLTTEQATERLALAGLPFLFYGDAASGRGHLLYVRHDGHYGLITPVE